MATTLAEQVQEAFSADPALCSRVQATLTDQPDNTQVTLVLAEISSYVVQLRQENVARRRALEELQATANERPAKRRRIPSQEGLIPGGLNQSTPAAASGHVRTTSNFERDDTLIVPHGRSRAFDTESDRPEEPVLRFEDISFSLPMRKKMLVEFIAANSNGDGSLRARPLNGTFDDGVTLCWDEMEYVFSIPVPERATPASYIVIVPRSSTSDSIVFVCPATPPKGFTSMDPDVSIREDEMFNALMKRVLNVQLAHMGKRVVVPEDREFVSGKVQAHRKDEKHFFVRAHKGRQEGYLHFLPPGILWGFKKPIIFFPFSNIRSISYTSILTRTFNLVISPNFPDPETNAKDDTVFEMLDQEDYQGIDDYVKRHRLNDESMAAQRQAQRYNVNGPDSTAAAESAEGQGENAAEAGNSKQRLMLNGDDGTTGRERYMTEQEIQDAEDEEEEDFDPSGGSSDGSGSGSEEEDEEGEGEAEGEDEGEDL